MNNKQHPFISVLLIICLFLILAGIGVFFFAKTESIINPTKEIPKEIKLQNNHELDMTMASEFLDRRLDSLRDQANKMYSVGFETGVRTLAEEMNSYCYETKVDTTYITNHDNHIIFKFKDGKVYYLPKPEDLIDK